MVSSRVHPVSGPRFELRIAPRLEAWPRMAVVRSFVNFLSRRTHGVPLTLPDATIRVLVQDSRRVDLATGEPVVGGPNGVGGCFALLEPVPEGEFNSSAMLRKDYLISVAGASDYSSRFLFELDGPAGRIATALAQLSTWQARFNGPPAASVDHPRAGDFDGPEGVFVHRREMEVWQALHAALLESFFTANPRIYDNPALLAQAAVPVPATPGVAEP